jgi:hypothetical protein
VISRNAFLKRSSGSGTFGADGDVLMVLACQQKCGKIILKCNKMLLTFSLLFRGFFKFVLRFFTSGGSADFLAYEPRLEMLDRAPKDLFSIVREGEY